MHRALLSTLLGILVSLLFGCASAPKPQPCTTFTYGCGETFTCCNNDGKLCPLHLQAIGCTKGTVPELPEGAK